MNNPLKYSNCWEDAILLGNALQVDHHSQVMSIASGGDNSLYLLSQNPASILCIDTNPIQIGLTRIKECAIRHLEYQEFLELLGFLDSPRKQKILEKIKPYLGPFEVKIFSQYGLNKTLVHSGKFETYLRFFARRMLPLIHSRQTIDTLLSIKSAEDQKKIYHQIWNSLRWKVFFKLFFNRISMGVFGREPQKLKQVKVPVSTTIFERAERHLTSTLCQKNFMLHYIFKGFFPILPPYAKKENFIRIKSWLNRNKIIYFNGDLQSALRSHPGYNRFNLSNIFEYMSQDIFEQHMESIARSSDQGSILCYWSLLVERKTTNDSLFPAPITSNDLGFFYQQCHALTTIG